MAFHILGSSRFFRGGGEAPIQQQGWIQKNWQKGVQFNCILPWLDSVTLVQKYLAHINIQEQGWAAGPISLKSVPALRVIILPPTDALAQV